MRDATSLPHESQFVGRLWNPTTATGNYDLNAVKKDLIILHSMDGFLDGTTSHFRNPSTKQSANYGIGLDGRKVLWIPENAVSYNSGVYPVNQRSISIEHEDNRNNKMVRSNELYESSAQLVVDICKAWDIPIDREHIKKHNEIKATDCPGTLDVDRIVNRAREIASGVSGEPRQMVQVEPQVFSNIVTKSSELDEVWRALGLPEDLKGRVGSHKLILEYFDAKLSEARNVPSTTPSVVLSGVDVPISPSEQPKPTKKNSVKELLGSILALLKERN